MHKRRAPHQRVRKVMAPKNGKEDWEVTMELAEALGYPMHYNHPSEIVDEIARLTPTFAGVSYEKLEELGSIQWPCNAKAPRRDAGYAYRRVCARQGQVHDYGVHPHG